MKKKIYYFFILLILLFVLYAIFVPKVVFINQSGRDLFIYGQFIYKTEPPKQAEGEQSSLNHGVLRKDKKRNYWLSWTTNENSSFWASWYAIKGNGKPKIQNRMTLSSEDFGWKNVVFIIDENGDYHKKTD